ncbi:REPTOR-binding partner [Brevipalpus obovatus]|uniref:REPTOR-binding partner n=1 Tax=Brevipalpus obovatus TaxID=246614 RepID=UPI003D9ED196
MPNSGKNLNLIDPNRASCSFSRRDEGRHSERRLRQSKKIKLDQPDTDSTRKSDPVEHPKSSGKQSNGEKSNASSGKRGLRTRKSTTRSDVCSKLERSRQSARECRARKKLRYQYLEELVKKTENAVLALRRELESYREWCKAVDSGADPKQALETIVGQGQGCCW